MILQSVWAETHGLANTLKEFKGECFQADKEYLIWWELRHPGRDK